MHILLPNPNQKPELEQSMVRLRSKCEKVTINTWVLAWTIHVHRPRARRIIGLDLNAQTPSKTYSWEEVNLEIGQDSSSPDVHGSFH